MIGEYARFNDGQIRRITGKDVDGYYTVDLSYHGGNWLTSFEVKEIKVHSKEFIDLVESGDYINGMLVTEVVDVVCGDKSGRYILCNRDEKCIDPPVRISSSEAIKNLLTKEVYEKGMYEV